MTNETTAALRALEDRVRALELRVADGPSAAGPADVIGDRFWVLNGLSERLGDGEGGVIYAGTVSTVDGPISWQYKHSDTELMASSDADDQTVDRLSALGSATRMRIMREVLRGVSSVAGLAALEGMGTTGQVYHHVRILSSAGWLHAAGRGALRVPPDRVVPFLLAVAATR